MARESYFKRFMRIMAGLFICSIGTYFNIKANVGLGPWEALHIGISQTIGIKYGTASILVSAVVILADIVMREKIGFGTILNAVVFAKWVDFWNFIDPLPLQHSMIIGLPMMFMGMVCQGVGTWLYMSAAMGSGPRDSMMVGFGRLAPKAPIGIIKFSMELVVVIIGFLLGAKIGVGTLIVVTSMSTVFQTIFAIVRFEPRNVIHENIADTLRNFKI